VYHRSWRNKYFLLRSRYGIGQSALYANYSTIYDQYGLNRLRSDVE
jgi:hypothetical protein